MDPEQTTDPGVSLVVITRNRCAELVADLERLTALDDVREVVVVDNGSTDGTSGAVAAAYPDVVLLRSPCNLGAAGRTVGAQAARSELVAFADDDSWWEPGALGRAAAVFAAHPWLGLLHARLLVGPGDREDPLCRLLAAGPTAPGAAGPSVLGHLACAVVVRRAAYLEAGGYHPATGVGGEERLLSLDLARLGWAQWYVDAVVARHAPSARREPAPARVARALRNDAFTAWLRLPRRAAVAATARLLRAAVREPAARREVGQLLRLVPTIRAERQPVPSAVVRLLAAVRG